MIRNLPELPQKSEEELLKKGCLVRVVDDDAAMRRSYRFILASQGWNAVCYESAEDFLEDLREEPGCLILDVRMPQMSGLELQYEMNRLGISMPVIFVTGHGDLEMAVKAIRDGAGDFMMKPVSPDRLRIALLRWCAHDRKEKLSRLRSRAEDRNIETLSDREREVMMLIAAGDPYKRIADKLGIAERTVKFHRAALCRKLGVRTTAELVTLVCQNPKFGNGK